MVNKILDAAGIVHAETAFLRQPEGTFAVWGDKITADGSDYGNELLLHEVTVELYENPDFPEDASRRALMDALYDAYTDGLIDRWDCEMRVWVEDVRLFMTTFNFSYLERR